MPAPAGALGLLARTVEPGRVRDAGEDARTAGVVLLAAIVYVFGVLLRFLWAGPPTVRSASWAAATIPGYGAVAGGATYEELLVLGDTIGDVSSGLSEEQIAVFPTYTIPAADAGAASADGENEVPRSCAVCLEYFRPGDVVQVLPCSETFHKECVKLIAFPCCAQRCCVGAVETDCWIFLFTSLLFLRADVSDAGSDKSRRVRCVEAASPKMTQQVYKNAIGIPPGGSLAPDQHSSRG